MPFIRCYDQLFDECFQVEISAATALKVPSSAQVSETPFEGIPITSQYRSVSHPGWADEQEEKTE
jgi:hypothetical protein